MAQANNGGELWYLIAVNGHGEWVSATLVALDPADAVIPPAATIPPPPRPTATPIPLPTSTPAVSSGTWNQASTVVSNSCGGTVGTNTTMLALITFNGDTLSLLYGGSESPVILARTTNLIYVGSYTNPVSAVSVRLTFSSPTTYSGDEVVTDTDGCVIRSSWIGTFSGS